SIRFTLFYFLNHPPGDVIATEGEQVTLGCQFDADDTRNLNLFWYKHELNGFPKFMLGRFPFGSKNATEFKDRFDAHLDADSKSVPLMIQRVQLSDSAVYYCALRPTVTTGYTTPLQKHTELHNDNTPVCTVYKPGVSSSSMLPKSGSHLITCSGVLWLGGKSC
uniref:Ig-like domain-containing protein n=1 Tax=Salmo trutta TaxID=8032 RepID=A0A674F528_SALTR